MLPGYSVRPYDDDEIARLAGLGLTPETDTSVVIDGPGPSLWFQQVPEPKAGKNRLHLDLREVDVHAVVAAGARVAFVGESHVTLLDPEGNELCVLDVPQVQLQGLAEQTGQPPA